MEDKTRQFDHTMWVHVCVCVQLQPESCVFLRRRGWRMAARFPWSAMQQEILSLPSPGWKMGILWVCRSSVCFRFKAGIWTIWVSLAVSLALAEFLCSCYIILLNSAKSVKQCSGISFAKQNLSDVFLKSISIYSINFVIPASYVYRGWSLLNACDLSKNILVSFTAVEFGSNITKHSQHQRKSRSWHFDTLSAAEPYIMGKLWQ